LLGRRRLQFWSGGRIHFHQRLPQQRGDRGCVILTNGSPNQPHGDFGGILRLNTAIEPACLGLVLNGRAFEHRLHYGFPVHYRQWRWAWDGIALVIQGDPAGTGAIGYTGDGQNMSYGNNDDPMPVARAMRS